MVQLMNGPDSFEMPISGVRIGPVAFIGLPGEPFNGIGRAIKDTEGYGLIIPCCLTNGGEGYYATAEAYDQGGYEPRNSRFVKGVGETLGQTSIDLLKSM